MLHLQVQMDTQDRNGSNIHIIEPTEMKNRKSRESSKKIVSKNTLELKYMSH